jgi:large subunit ribosomal protein L13
LRGNEIRIVNSDKALISGTDVWNIKDFKELRALNTMKPGKGPFFSKNSEKIMKRAIRGMLPDFRVGRGRDAWKKIKCYNEIPEELKNEKMIKLVKNIPKRVITIKEMRDRA